LRFNSTANARELALIKTKRLRAKQFFNHIALNSLAIVFLLNKEGLRLPRFADKLQIKTSAQWQKTIRRNSVASVNFGGKAFFAES